MEALNRLLYYQIKTFLCEIVSFVPSLYVFHVLLVPNDLVNCSVM